MEKLWGTKESPLALKYIRFCPELGVVVGKDLMMRFKTSCVGDQSATPSSLPSGNPSILSTFTKYLPCASQALGTRDTLETRSVFSEPAPKEKSQPYNGK